MCNTLQVGCHLEKLYAEYLRRHTALVLCGAKLDSDPLSPTAFGTAWGKWCDRYGASSECPDAWGDVFLEHEYGPLV